MKVIVVGGVAAGASAAARLRRLDDNAEIIVFERGEHVSFSNCALPYYIGGDVKNSNQLIMMTPEAFRKRHGIDVRVNSEVISIDKVQKKVSVRETKTGKEYEESYDKLILTPGASPIRPRSIKGIDGGNVFTLRNVADVCAFKTYLEDHDVQNVAVVGGGFIGIEVAENLVKQGRKVHLIEGQNQIVAPFDYDMAQILHKEMLDNGVELHLEHMLTEITENSVITTSSGEKHEIPAEAVLLSIGVAPETKLAVDAGIEIGSTRGIKVDHNYQTNVADIYAVGDAVESYNRLAHVPGILALAGPAQRAARAAADHICGQYNRTRGYIGSSCLRVFGLNAACTGMNEKAAAKAGIPCEIAYVLPSDIVKIMPEAHYMVFKLIFEVPTGRVLGAQAIGQGDVTKRVDIIATVIAMGGTLEDLKDLELCYSPVFGTAKDVVNMAALVGLNILNRQYKQIHVDAVRSLVENGAYFLDVREAEDFEAGHVLNAHSIPLSELRGRMNEVPKDIPVYVYCRTAQRSYYAVCELQGQGFTNVINVSGSFLGISLYEYFNDQTKKREPIVTAYNFV